jgi:hypothetical protein
MKTSPTALGVLILCCLSIIACKPTKPGADLTGVFAGPVAGLSYETATLSGLTNARGEFKYKQGETVTFSVGGIALGSVAGAAKISPFSLLPLATPPATELALRMELGNRKDVTDFDRAANIAFLLVSLDLDANPDNGLDLTGWDSSLAAATLNFNADLYQFARKFRRFASANGINSNITPIQPLAHVYKSLGITVPVHLVTSVLTDSDAVDVTYGYDTKSLKNAHRTDFNNDGISNQTESYTYTAQARVATHSRVFDWDDNGVPDSTLSEIFTYNGNGDVVTLVAQEDFDGNGAPDTRSTTTNIYNSVGDLMSSLLEIDSNLDSVADERYESTYTYDAAGNMLTAVREDDFNVDGTPESVVSRTLTYDAAGNLLTRLQENDSDGVPGADSIESEINTYDAAGNRLTSQVTNDYENDGTLDYLRTETNTYDSKANLLTSLSEECFDGTTVNTRLRRTLTYNSAGTLLLTDSTEFDSDDADPYDFRETITYTHDSNGNRLTQLTETDTDGDGSVDTASLFQRAYSTISDGILSLLFDYSDLTQLGT